MSTHCITTIIDRRANISHDEPLVTYFRHYDGSPRSHGKHLVELIMETAASSPEKLVEALAAHWTTPSIRPNGSMTPLLERTTSHMSWGAIPYRYDVIYELEDRQPICRVECFTRNGGQDGDWRAETEREWLAIEAKLSRTVSLWPPVLPAPHVRGRLSSLSV